ncbi:MAG: hypothetical protein ACXAD7_23090, partial [Candidatus Kariarchaeaceae archaeon]
IYIGFVYRQKNAGYDTINVGVTYYGVEGGWYSQGAYHFSAQYNVAPGEVSHFTPRVFPLPNAPFGYVGIMYQYKFSANLYLLNYGYINFNPAVATLTTSAIGLPYYGVQNDDLRVRNFDIAQNPQNPYRYDLVFSGYYLDGNHLALDIYYAEMSVSGWDTGVDELTKPSKIVDSGLGQFNPSIMREPETNNLIVGFEQSSQSPYGGLHSVVSTDDAASWSDPKSLVPKLGFEDRERVIPHNSPSGNSFSAMVYPELKPLQDFEALRPILVPSNVTGYTLNYLIYFNFTNYFPSIDDCSGIVDPDYHYTGLIYDLSNACGFQYDIAIATAHNSNNYFTRFDIDKSEKVVVGDTDKDGRHEILSMNERNAILFEYESNSVDSMLHMQEWESPTYDRDLTDIAISDSNGNSLPEIIIESDRGVVNSFEVIDTRYMNSPDLIFAKETQLEQLRIGKSIIDHKIEGLLEVDINEDQYMDFLAFTNKGYVFAYNGETLSTFYMVQSLDLGATNAYGLAELQLIKYGGNIGYFAYKHNKQVYICDIKSGEIILEYSYPIGDPVLISAMDVGDFNRDGKDDIALGYEDGSFHVIDMEGSLLSEKRNADFNSIRKDITNIALGNFISVDELSIAITSLEGVVELYTDKGNALWSTTQNFHTIDALYTSFLPNKMVKTDLNGDSLQDIIVGANNSVAINGLTGELLWKVALMESTSSIGKGSVNKPNLTDLNADGTDEIIHSIYSDKFNRGPSNVIIDGKTGDIIWSDGYDLSNFAYFSETNFIKTDWNQDIVFAVERIGTNAGNYYGGVIYDIDSGKSLGFGRTNIIIQSTLEYTPIIGDPEKVLLIGGIHGEIAKIEFVQGITPAIPDILDAKQTSDFHLDVNFDTDMDILLYDRFSNGLVGTDGYDDLFLIGDDYVLALDFIELSNNRPSVIWNLSSNLGYYLNQAEIADFTGDGVPELIAAFSTGLKVFNINDGTILFDYTSINNNVRFEIADWITGGPIEIAYSQNIRRVQMFPSFKMIFETQIGVLSNTVANVPYYYLTTTDRWDSKWDLYDIDGDSNLEIISYANKLFDSTQSTVLVIETDFSVPLTKNYSFGQIREVLIGNFDPKVGYEVIFYFDGQLDDRAKDQPFMIMYNYDRDIQDFILPTKAFYGESPISDTSKAFQKVNVDGGYEDILVETDSGTMWTQKLGIGSLNRITMPIDSYLENTDVIEVTGTPQSDTRLIFGNVCGTNSIIQVISHNTIVCHMDIANFTLQNPPEWRFTIDHGYINDIIIGDLDDTNVHDDIMIVNNNGSVWVVDEVTIANILSLSQNGPYVEVNEDDENKIITKSDPSIALVLIPSFIAIIIVLRRKKLRIPIKYLIELVKLI